MPPSSSISPSLSSFPFATEMPDRANILAAIHCPFSLRVNAHARAAEEASLRWLERHRIAQGSWLEALAGAHLTTLVAGFYPSAGLQTAMPGVGLRVLGVRAGRPRRRDRRGPAPGAARAAVRILRRAAGRRAPPPGRQPAGPRPVRAPGSRRRADHARADERVHRRQPRLLRRHAVGGEQPRPPRGPRRGRVSGPAARRRSGAVVLRAHRTARRALAATGRPVTSGCVQPGPPGRRHHLLDQRPALRTTRNTRTAISTTW